MDFYSDSYKIIAIYDPVDHFCKVFQNGSRSCVITPDVELFRGDYDEVDEWIKNKKETESLIDAPVIEIEDRRGFREDYIPKYPIHPKQKKE